MATRAESLPEQERKETGNQASFPQPMGICVELDKNTFVTDAQTGLVKLITSIIKKVSSNF